MHFAVLSAPKMKGKFNMKIFKKLLTVALIVDYTVRTHGIVIASIELRPQGRRRQESEDDEGKDFLHLIKRKAHSMILKTMEASIIIIPRVCGV